VSAPEEAGAGRILRPPRARRNSAMPLKLSLKPQEKFVLNGAVLTNSDKRTSLVLQNKACVLREKDIMQPEDANTPARRIYFPIMMMYLEPDDSERYYTDFALRMTEFMGAIHNRAALATCLEISRDVMAGGYYKALMNCKKLFEFEGERLSYVAQSLSKHAANY
jgi:flagellar biosynthesis repressor protein FlbT